MAGEFVERKLGQLMSFANGRSSPGRANSLSYPVFGANGVIGFAAEANAGAGSIVIGRVGSYCGSLHYSGQDCWVTDNAIRANAVSDNDSRFLFYLLQTLGLNNWRSGSGQPLLNQSILSSITARVPGPSEQRAIAQVLGTIDDKIDSNRRMSETLEAMARALFQSWFVDFHPVRAKVEGREARLPNLIADLFPNRLVESELGEIPEGWEAGCLRTVLTQRTERVGHFPAVVLSALSSGTLIKSSEHFTKRVHSAAIDRYLRVDQWDFAYNPSRVNIGSIGLLEDQVVGAVSPVYVVMRPAQDYVWFVEFNLRTSRTREWINTLASGSVRQSVSFKDLSSIPAVIPTVPAVRAFNEQWMLWRKRVKQLAEESATLSSLRDLLLPALVSGEVRIPAAARVLESTGTV